MTEIPYSGEKTAKAGDVELTYDTFGNPSSPPMLLIMGLGAQMIRWDDAFCQAIAAQGRWVIRFDNRDVGLSTKFDEAGVPDSMALLQGQKVEVPYSLKDMADDAVGLLDSLGIKAADIVGVSMGGMIAQTMAIHYPNRVRTLTSIMSSTGNPDLPQSTPEAMEVLIAPPVSNRNDYVTSQLKAAKVLHGPTYPLNEEYVRNYAERSYDRCYNPTGFARQLGAILGSGSRNEALRNVKIPTLVIHGDTDPLVPVAGGKDTAKSIPNAKLVIIEGMGHSFPTEMVPKILQELLQHTAP
ncbi:MAG: 3-oxoadipate enol-lactonase 2 [Candidatus Thorarchaeota archaeon AB_25]|nr:MAG: 3-oxoadipate enol-lactonase 2 [Candidatus Thorarchaeota archaeon AB_25]